ncbi:MAG: MBL fold metallo-hydrolase [Clostridia bacterium]|nr:MBL fold metallo-hydrolase [Clostridia bacterium]
MKITFLGTSHGVPAADRFCSCSMIEAGDAVYFIDAGAPLVESVLKAGRQVSDVRALFTTHVHGDHTAGLFHLADLVDWYYREHSMDFYVADGCLVDATKGMIVACNGGKAVHEDRVRFHVIDPSVPYEDENIKIEFIPTKHMPEPYHSYSMLVTEGDRRVLFSGDFSNRLAKADVPELLSEEPVDAFICEMAHFGVEDIKPYLDTCKAKAVYFQHVFPLVKYDGIKEISKSYDFPIYTPNDGDSFEV